MPQRVIASLRDWQRLVALSPALAVSAIALFVLPHTAGGFRLAKWGAFGLGLGIIAVGLLVTGRKLRFPRHWWPVVVFVAAAILLPSLSSALMPTHWPTTLSMLSGVALFFATALALYDATRVASFTVLIVTGALCAWLVLLQFAGLTWLTSDVYTGIEFRAPGTFGNPNWAAAFLAALVPLALARAAIAERKAAFHVAAVLLAVAALVTLSKNGLLTLAAGMGVFAVMSLAGRLRYLILAGGVLGAVTTVTLLAMRFTEESWLRGRIFLWRVALLIVGDHPLTGVGLGGYLPAYGRGAATLVNGDPTAFMPLSSIDFAHNDVLQFAAEGGVLTAIAFVFLCLAAIAFSHRLADPLARGAGAAVAALFANGLVDSPLKVPSTFALLFFLLGWLASKTPRAATSGHASRAMLVAIVVLGAVQGVRFLAGDVYWTRGRDALRANSPAVSALEKARFFLPEHGRSASQYTRALAREGKINAALDASAVAAGRRFDFDDEIFARELRARAMDREASILMWQELAATFPSLITPHLRLGSLHLQANDRAAATREYETVVANTQPTRRAEAARMQARTLLDTTLLRP